MATVEALQNGVTMTKTEWVKHQQDLSKLLMAYLPLTVMALCGATIQFGGASEVEMLIVAGIAGMTVLACWAVGLMVKTDPDALAPTKLLAMLDANTSEALLSMAPDRPITVFDVARARHDAECAAKGRHVAQAAASQRAVLRKQD